MVAEARPMTLLERAPALDALATALAEAAAGEGRVALVYGEAGIGKTSLVDHFTGARRAPLRGLEARSLEYLEGSRRVVRL
jgi:putative ribosome biogenesis GTPase RsgA